MPNAEVVGGALFKICNLSFKRATGFFRSAEGESGVGAALCHRSPKRALWAKTEG